ncbi:MAG: hypothetical protein AAGA81_12145 [Acidobacteriota bacterium]
MKNLALWTTIAVSALLVTDIAEAQRKKNKETRNENIPLVWTPTTELGELDPIDLTGVTGTAIEIGEITDSRRETEEIGRNVEDARPKLVTTPDNVAEFVRDKVGDLMFDMGFKVVKSDAEFRLEGELRKFYCEEDNTYEAETVMVMKLIDGSGNAVWESLITGSSTRWGRSYKDENYYESLADSLIEATHRIASSADFRRALRK